jgi:hypothetical protein
VGSINLETESFDYTEDFQHAAMDDIAGWRNGALDALSLSDADMWPCSRTGSQHLSPEHRVSAITFVKK